MKVYVPRQGITSKLLLVVRLVESSHNVLDQLMGIPGSAIVLAVV